MRAENKIKIEFKNSFAAFYILIFYFAFIMSVCMLFIDKKELVVSKLMPIVWYSMIAVFFVGAIAYLPKVVLSLKFTGDELIIKKWKYFHSKETILRLIVRN